MHSMGFVLRVPLQATNMTLLSRAQASLCSVQCRTGVVCAGGRRIEGRLLRRQVTVANQVLRSRSKRH